MEGFNNFLDKFSSLIWDTGLSTFGINIPILSNFSFIVLLLLGTGAYLTVRLRFMPILKIPAAFKMLWDGRKSDSADGEVSPFAALATALSSTVGTGNLAGVATAIAIGGPGAIFWMWMTALVGMATKYSESLLAVRYREVDENGVYKGGPMYYIKNGLGPKWKWLAVLFCIGAIASSAGAGNMAQGNSIAEVVQTNVGMPKWGTGLILAVLTFGIIIGGIKSIGKVASKLVPVMGVGYVICAIIVLVMNYQGIPNAFGEIFSSAFSGSAAVGGFSGAVIAEAVRAGVSRGLFSNEAGQGSAPIAHAAAQTKDPARQATIAMLGTFIDTIVICTMTALIILTVSGSFGSMDANGVATTVDYAWQSTTLESASITSEAFKASGIPFGGLIITFTLIIFAFTTILGWSYYGERAIAYLFGEGLVKPFRIAWCFVVFAGATLPVKAVWTMGDIGNGLMATPNLIAVLLLSGVVVSIARGGKDTRKVEPHDDSAHAKGLHSHD